MEFAEGYSIKHLFGWKSKAKDVVYHQSVLKTKVGTIWLTNLRSWSSFGKPWGGLRPAFTFQSLILSKSLSSQNPPWFECATVHNADAGDPNAWKSRTLWRAVSDVIVTPPQINMTHFAFHMTQWLKNRTFQFIRETKWSRTSTDITVGLTGQLKSLRQKLETSRVFSAVILPMLNPGPITESSESFFGSTGSTRLCCRWSNVAQYHKLQVMISDNRPESGRSWRSNQSGRRIWVWREAASRS